MNNKFSVDYSSDVRYEILTAEISFKEQLLCQLNVDKGYVEIEFFTDFRILADRVNFKFPMHDFVHLLTALEIELLEIAKNARN